MERKQLDDLAPFAARAFAAVADEWELTEQERRAALAGGSLAAGSIDEGTLLRVSVLLGIYNTLHALFTDPAKANSWIRRDNSGLAFNGSPAIERMLSPSLSEVEAVRAYLASTVASS